MSQQLDQFASCGLVPWTISFDPALSLWLASCIMHSFQAQREAHLHELCAVLSSLWEALGGEVTAAEKATVSDLFTGPQKLYGHNIQAVSLSQKTCNDSQIIQNAFCRYITYWSCRGRESAYNISTLKSTEKVH
jgi:hypothetical protein